MNEFEDCLKRKKIIKYPKIKARLRDEIMVAREDLKDAEDLFKRKRFKYATIAGYYSLFHSARALIFSRGYRERSHYCLKVAIRELFVKEGILELKFLEYLDEAMGLREIADYQSHYSREGAERTILGAREFLKETRKVLKKPRNPTIR